MNVLTQPDSDAVKLSYCPASAIALDGLVIEAMQDTDAIIVNVPDLTELVVSEGEAESVIITLACSVFPTMFDGITHANEFVVPVIPVYSWFATIVPVIVLVIM